MLKKSIYSIFVFLGLLLMPITETTANIQTHEISNRPIVRLETNKGDIILQLDLEKAPITVKNFLQYVEDKHYNGTLFHRVIPGFMIQTGGFSKGLKEKKARSPIKNEATNGLKNKRGTVAMARRQAIDSASAQFFINVVDNEYLDYKDKYNYGYAVFGHVISGMDVVDKISKTKTSRINVYSDKYKRHIPFADVPKEDIIIHKASIIRKTK